jgi:hypothetical protein
VKGLQSRDESGQRVLAYRLEVVRTVLATGAALALLAAGCAGREETAAPRPAPPLAERLAGLCERTRVSVEALGEPKDVGAAVFRPWAEIGERFVADVRGLEAPTPRRRAQVQALADGYAGFYESLDLGYEQWRSGESAAVKMTLARAYAQLTAAEAAAGRLGASACSVRPFDDT